MGGDHGMLLPLENSEPLITIYHVDMNQLSPESSETVDRLTGHPNDHHNA